MKKKIFRIGELSSLFDISVDSIRYYEKIDIIHPIHNPDNGYREYTLKDVQTLMTIRELLRLGFSSEQIKHFMENNTVENTITMLEEELSTINSSIQQLQKTKANIQNHLQGIKKALSVTDLETIKLFTLPKRSCIMITNDNLSDDYVNYYTIKFMKETRQTINMIGSCDCYTLDLAHSDPSSDYYRTKNVFYLVTSDCLESNYYLPAGNYLSISYRGTPRKTKDLLPLLFDYANKHQYQITGDPIELCHIDDTETENEEEFFIELQLPVS